MGAHLADPLEVALLGFVPNAIAGRVLAKAGQVSLAKRAAVFAKTEMAAAAAFETPTQFLQIKPYKNELGIEYTNWDAANNAFFATVFSGIAAGGFEFLGGGLRKLATGEWTPKEFNGWVSENYTKLSDEQREMVDMAMQARDHEMLNPHGPSVEGRAQHNADMADITKHAHSTGRKVTDEEL